MNLLHPAEAAVAGTLFALHATFVTNGMILDGIVRYYSFWSCWNYAINAAMYFLLLLARGPGKLRTFVYLATPYTFGLDVLWAGLTVLMAVLGADAAAGYTGGVPDGEDVVAYLSRFCTTVYLHFSPMIAWGIFAVRRLDDIRLTYDGRLLRSTKEWNVFARILSIVLVIWTPWLLFVIYVLIKNPFVVYGIEPPSWGAIAGYGAVSFVLYSGVLGGLLTLVHMRRKPQAINKSKQFVGAVFRAYRTSF